MGDVKKVKDAYSKLKKENPGLPEAGEFFAVFGIFEEDDLSGLVKLFKKVRKIPSNVAHWILELLSPPDPIAAHDNQATKHMKKELMESLKKCVLADKTLTLASFEAARSKDPEEVLAGAIRKVTAELKPVAELLEEVTKITLESWKKGADEEEVSYRW